MVQNRHFYEKELSKSSDERYLYYNPCSKPIHCLQAMSINVTFSVQSNSFAAKLGFANITKLPKWIPGCSTDDTNEKKQFSR